MHIFTQRTACIREQIFLDRSVSWLEKGNYLFCSSSSSFLFIMATMAWRSSSKQKGQRRLISLCIFAHLRSKSHVHSGTNSATCLRWCQHNLLFSKAHKNALNIITNLSNLSKLVLFNTVSEVLLRSISLHPSLTEMFTSLPAAAAVLF